MNWIKRLFEIGATRRIDTEDDSRRVVVCETLPKMDASSAVFPTARVTRDAFVVAYHLPGCEASAVLRFRDMRDWHYGYPNDEGLTDHPLWGSGITFYEFHEVIRTDSDAESGQWIATFHDGTLTIEAAAVEVVSESVPGKPWEAIDDSLGAGDNLILDAP